MASPNPDSYSAPSGRKLHAGRRAKALAGAAAGVGSASGSLSVAAGGDAALSGVAAAVAAAIGALTVNGSSGSLNASLTLISAVTSATVPFTAGYAFKQGEVPTGTGVAVTGATAQVTAKNTWPDGSLKFAVIAGTANLTAGVAAAVTVASGTASSGTALSIADLKTAMSGQTCSIGCGAFGTVSWATTDFDSPFETWVSGHRMSSWLYRKPVGSDAHLVGWLEVRLYAGGAVEVLPWIENGYLMVAGPTSKSATYTFTLGSTVRNGGGSGSAIDLPHHCRTPLVSGTATSYWLGTSHDVNVKHDGDYLQRTGMVPAYSAKPADGSSRIAALPTTYTPLQQGSWPTTMGAGGYSPSIGLLPEWEVLYLTNGNATTYKGVIFNGYSTGRYPFHFRDEADSNRWARLSNHVTLQAGRAPEAGFVTTPATTGTAPPPFSVSHQPSVGYLAYLITGRRYFLDELQAAESGNSMADPASQRENGSGLCKSNQAGTIRRVAWTMRTLWQAIAATPDADTTYVTEFKARAVANINYYHARYVVTAPNAFGLVTPYEGAGAYGNASVAGTIWLGAMWMQDFLTASFGYAKDLGLNLGSTPMSQLDAFFSWKAQSIVGRLGAAGDATGAPYRAFAPYNWALCPASANFATGTGFYASWRAAFNATYGGAEADYTSNNGPYASPGADVDGAMLNYLGPDFQAAEALPAIAYAVKHGVTGATAAWQRLTSTGNWYELQNAIDVQPVWAVSPAATPRWLTGLAVDTWRELSGTTMYTHYPAATSVARQTDGTASVGSPWLDAYCGMGADSVDNSVWQIANGGHGDYYGNEVIKLDLQVDAPAWEEWLRGSNGNVVQTNAYATANYPTDTIFDTERGWYLDDGITGRLPASGHSYWGTQTIERFRRVVRFPGWSISPPGTGWKDVDGFRMDVAKGVNGWDAKLTYPGAPVGGYTAGSQGGTAIIRPTICKDPRTERVYMISAGGGRMWTPPIAAPSGVGTGGSWSSFTSGGASGQGASAVDTTRGRLFVCGGATASAHYFDIDGGSMTLTAVTLTGAAAATIAASPAGDGWGMVYVPQIDAYLFKRGTTDGAEIFKVNASTFAVTVYAPTGGGSVPLANFIASNNANVYNRWQYMPKLRGIVYAPKNAANVWFLRTH